MKSTAVVTVDVDKEGNIRYDAIVKQGANRGKIVQTSLDDLREKQGIVAGPPPPLSLSLLTQTPSEFIISSSSHHHRIGDKAATALPCTDEEEATAERTRQALEALLNGKIAMAKPSNAVVIKEQNTLESEYIRYTANPDAPG